MKWFLFISILFLHACSNLPANIKNPPSVDIQLHQALKNSSSFQNYPVRWGGTIIDVENEANETKMQILFYPLNYYGRPKLNKPSSGRFITVSKQFLDPAIYANGTSITVVGTLQGTLEKQIGKKIITVPIVSINSFHIWPQYPQNYYSPYGYYPNYYGYGYRYYPYSYYRGGYYYH